MSGPPLESYRLLMADVYELAGESRGSSEAIAQQLGQTAARWHVLSVLSDGPRTAASAARRLGLARQSVQRVVHDLRAGDLVVSQTNPDHVSAPLLALTPKGEETLSRLIRRSDSSRSQVLRSGALTATELDSARATIRKLVDALRQVEVETGADLDASGGLREGLIFQPASPHDRLMDIGG